MENKDVFMAAYERAEEKRNLQHAFFGSPASGFMRKQTLKGAENLGNLATNTATGTVKFVARKTKKAVKRADKKLKKLGKKTMKTGEKIVDTVETVGGWYGKE